MSVLFGLEELQNTLGGERFGEVDHGSGTNVIFCSFCISFLWHALET